ncbi:MAG: tetratricopeptide repeat protein [Acidobacteriota bacterium]
MSTERHEQAKAILRQMMDRTPDQREAWLNEACRDDVGLRHEVEMLMLEASTSPTQPFLDIQGIVAAAVKLIPPDAASPLIGELIGPYKLIRELGKGGMGIVFLGERADDQYKKRVAVKVIKRGMDTEEIVARFRHERQILASLDHPNIARLLDGGTTADGLPYFVMEHIEGQPIDEYCSTHKLTTNERLNLFRTVCGAVHYAHQNLVVHRDLKPTNILVTEDGTVKLLDFGIAKILNPEMFPETVLPTRTWERPMTPAYASPEQVRGQTITTASDVYSLGVVLYELLTGRRPYEFKSLAPHEIAKVVCETQPIRPSTAVRQPETARPESSVKDSDGQHHLETNVEAERLSRRLQGDLDNIVLMALRKEPQRRYVSAQQLSEDIGRHLAGRPVIAREDTLGYRAEKFVKRNKAAVAAAAVFVVLLAGFAVTMWVQSVRVARERDRAERERDKAARVSSFLVDLFKVNDPSESKGNAVTAREILDKGAEKVAEELKQQPETQATLMQTMGDAYQSLGLLDRALPLLEDSLKLRRQASGSNQPDTASSLQSLGELHVTRGEFDKAEPLFRESLDIRRKLYGSEHQAIAESLNSLGNLFYNKRDYKTAEPLLRDAIAMQRKLAGSENAPLANYESNLAQTLQDQGSFDEAEKLNRESLAIQRKLLGEAHPDVVSSLNNLAVLLLKKRDLDGAEQTFRQLLAAGRKLYGEENHHVGLYLANLGYVLSEKGNQAEAETLLRRALEIRRKTLPPGSPEIAHSSILLGRLLVTKSEVQEAEPLLREAVETFRRTFPKTSTMTADAENVLGECLTELRRYDEAEALLTASYKTIYDYKGNATKLAQQALRRLIKLYEAKGQPTKATQYRELLAK